MKKAEQPRPPKRPLNERELRALLEMFPMAERHIYASETNVWVRPSPDSRLVRIDRSDLLKLEVSRHTAGGSESQRSPAFRPKFIQHCSSSLIGFAAVAIPLVDEE